MCDGRPLDRPVPAEGEARLAVDVLRVPCVRAIVALVDGDLDLRSFRMGLPRIGRGTEKYQTDRNNIETTYSLIFLSVCFFNVHPHHVVENEAGVRQFEVFEQTVELPAVQRAPGTVQVVPGLRLLPRVIVVLELEDRGGQREDGDFICNRLCLTSLPLILQLTLPHEFHSSVSSVQAHEGSRRRGSPVPFMETIF